ncbi:MAG: hypothetical protein AAGA62_01975, partial [Bacteroidota bacterium]
ILLAMLAFSIFYHSVHQRPRPHNVLVHTILPVLGQITISSLRIILGPPLFLIWRNSWLRDGQKDKRH